MTSTIDQYEDILISYIEQFGFDGDIRKLDYKVLKKQNEQLPDYTTFHAWCHAKENRSKVNTILRSNKETIKAVNERKKEAWKNFRKGLKRKLPTLKSVSTFVGMFDEA